MNMNTTKHRHSTETDTNMYRAMDMNIIHGYVRDCVHVCVQTTKQIFW